MADVFQVVVIGGANIDTYAKPEGSLSFGDSRVGVIYDTHGGVGRNVAENLGRLGVKTLFLSALGDDAPGSAIGRRLNDAGVHVLSFPVRRTSRYVAMLDANGDLTAAVSDMEGIDYLGVDVIERYAQRIDTASTIVVEANLRPDLLSFLFERFSEKTIAADTISKEKAPKLKPYLKHIDILKTNRREAAALVCPRHRVEGHDLATWLKQEGAGSVYVTMGADGVVWRDGERHGMMRAPECKIINTTGAGDAFLAGLVYADIFGLDRLSHGTAMSMLTLGVLGSVVPKLTAKILEETVFTIGQDPHGQ